jgi:Oxidoreductase molybdopterin binding domain
MAHTTVWAAIALLSLGTVSRTAQAQTPASSQPAGQMSGMSPSNPQLPTGPLKITFADKSAEWTPAALAPLPHKTLTLYNEHAKTNQTYTGVPLIDLLTRLGVPDKPHGKDFRLYLIAEGADAYQVVYSLGEVTPDVHDATVIVADTLDGRPIAEDGPLKLVATGEKRPARWVRNLVTIRVLTAQ